MARKSAHFERRGERPGFGRRPALLVLTVLLVVGLLAVPALGRPAPQAGDNPAAAAAARGAQLPGPPAGDDHEIWLPDQGTDTIHIYDSGLNEIDTIELGPDSFEGHDIVMPHMFDFDSEYRYAFIANPASGNVAIIDAAAREVVEVIETGPGTHMAAVTPDDSAVWVAVIAGERFTQIELGDLDAADPTFEVGHVIDTSEALADAEYDYPSAGAVCHEYTADSQYAYLTFGPGADQGGLVVIDVKADEPGIVQFYDPEEVKANCGLASSTDGSKMYANWGGDVAEGVDGEWYAFDAETHEQIHTASSQGIDAHGVRAHPDGRQLWMVNRATSNAIIIDQRTDRVIRELPFVGHSPDILDFSPNGRYAYVSLRGPAPLSGPHAIAGDTPGFAVLHVPSGRLLDVVQQEPQYGEVDGEQVLRNDPHGIGVRASTEVTE